MEDIIESINRYFNNPILYINKERKLVFSDYAIINCKQSKSKLKFFLSKNYYFTKEDFFYFFDDLCDYMNLEYCISQIDKIEKKVYMVNSNFKEPILKYKNKRVEFITPTARPIHRQNKLNKLLIQKGDLNYDILVSYFSDLKFLPHASCTPKLMDDCYSDLSKLIIDSKIQISDIIKFIDKYNNILYLENYIEDMIPNSFKYFNKYKDKFTNFLMANIEKQKNHNYNINYFTFLYKVVYILKETKFDRYIIENEYYKILKNVLSNIKYLKNNPILLESVQLVDEVEKYNKIELEEIKDEDFELYLSYYNKIMNKSKKIYNEIKENEDFDLINKYCRFNNEIFDNIIKFDNVKKYPYCNTNSKFVYNNDYFYFKIFFENKNKKTNIELKKPLKTLLYINKFIKDKYNFPLLITELRNIDKIVQDLNIYISNEKINIELTEKNLIIDNIDSKDFYIEYKNISKNYIEKIYNSSSNLDNYFINKNFSHMLIELKNYLINKGFKISISELMDLFNIVKDINILDKESFIDISRSIFCKSAFEYKNYVGLVNNFLATNNITSYEEILRLQEKENEKKYNEFKDKLKQEKIKKTNDIKEQNCENLANILKDNLNLFKFHLKSLNRLNDRDKEELQYILKTKKKLYLKDFILFNMDKVSKILNENKNFNIEKLVKDIEIVSKTNLKTYFNTNLADVLHYSINSFKNLEEIWNNFLKNKNKDLKNIQKELNQKLKEFEEENNKELNEIKLKYGVENHREVFIGKNAVIDLLNIQEKTISNLKEGEEKSLLEYIQLNAPKFRSKISSSMKISKKKQFDVKKTIEESVKFNGVPMRFYYKKPKYTKYKLVCFLDISGSVSMHLGLLSSFIYELNTVFNNGIEIFGFVSDLKDFTNTFKSVNKNTLRNEITGYRGYSNYYKALQDFNKDYLDHIDKNTIVLFFGDARNNANNLGLNLLQNITDKSKYNVWLNPENKSKWNKVDSVIGEYSKVMDKVYEINKVNQLIDFLNNFEIK